MKLASPHKPPEARRMNVKVEDLMTSQVLTASRHQTVGHVRELMASHGIHALPVVDSAGEVVGIVTSTDVVAEVSSTSKVSSVMSRDVVSVPAYAEPATAARMMRNKGIHHLIVTHEKKIVGILSTFDLLQLVEDHNFVAKNRPNQPHHKWAKRNKDPS